MCLRILSLQVRPPTAIRVKATDAGGLSVERAFSLAVVDQNDAPTSISITQSSLNENLGGNIAVGVFATVDQDGPGVFAYSLVSGVGAADGRIEFTPPAGQRLSTSFSYSVLDNDEVVSNTALVSVRIYSAFQNQRNSLDVDGNGKLDPLDKVARRG